MKTNLSQQYMLLVLQISVGDKEAALDEALVRKELALQDKAAFARADAAKR